MYIYVKYAICIPYNILRVTFEKLFNFNFTIYSTYVIIFYNIKLYFKLINLKFVKNDRNFLKVKFFLK